MTILPCPPGRTLQEPQRWLYLRQAKLRVEHVACRVFSELTDADLANLSRCDAEKLVAVLDYFQHVVPLCVRLRIMRQITQLNTAQSRTSLPVAGDGATYS